MRPSPLAGSQQCSRSRGCAQRGLGLVAAIGLIVLVSIVAAGLVSIMKSESGATTVGALELRAREAAESGVEVSLNRLFAPRGTGSCSNQSLTFTMNGLKGCAASVTCSPTDVGTVRHYDFVSEGRCVGTGAEAAVSRLVVRSSGS